MACAFVAALVLIYALRPDQKAAPPSPLPSPNGYDDFVKAGYLLALSTNYFTRMSVEELRSYVGTNQESLRLMRLGLNRECRVPVETTTVYTQEHVEDASRIKHAAQLLSAEGWLAEMEGRHDLAAKSHLERVRLGLASSMGGLLIDRLVGVAIEDVGLTGLERTAQRLNGLACKEIIQGLEGINASADSAAEYIKRERERNRRTIGWSVRLQVKLLGWVFSKPSFFEATDQKFTAKVITTDRRRRQLMLNLASRAYELEHGKRPLRAEDLVPSLLRAAPKDPETGTNLVLNPAN